MTCADTTPVASTPPWDLLVTCPRCGGALDLVAPGRPTDAGTRMATIVRCTACPSSAAEFVITTTITSTRNVS